MKNNETDSSNFFFCGVLMSGNEYDEIDAIFAYCYKHVPHLLTPLERRIAHSDFPITSDSEHWKVRKINEFLEKRDGHVPDESVHAASQEPSNEFHKSAVLRIMKDHAPEFPRCHECDRVLHVAQPLSCPWCRCKQPTIP